MDNSGFRYSDGFGRAVLVGFRESVAPWRQLLCGKREKSVTEQAACPVLRGKAHWTEAAGFAAGSRVGPG
jgi:hypothetical protein